MFCHICLFSSLSAFIFSRFASLSSRYFLFFARIACLECISAILLFSVSPVRISTPSSCRIYHYGRFCVYSFVVSPLCFPFSALSFGGIFFFSGSVFCLSICYDAVILWVEGCPFPHILCILSSLSDHDSQSSRMWLVSGDVAYWPVPRFSCTIHALYCSHPFLLRCFIVSGFRLLLLRRILFLFFRHALSLSSAAVLFLFSPMLFFPLSSFCVSPPFLYVFRSWGSFRPLSFSCFLLALFSFALPSLLFVVVWRHVPPSLLDSVVLALRPFFESIALASAPGEFPRADVFFLPASFVLCPRESGTFFGIVADAFYLAMV